MAEYGSGIFYGRSNSNQSSSNLSQLGILSLPSELDIGPPITPNVLKLNVDTPKDIILLAEFSEIEGPIPLLSIPQNNVQDIDLNEFVVQLMSTDYQNMGSSEFQIYKDTSLLQEDSERGHYTYVHYFTLYDVRARGFVRPMCLAYISREPEKLKKYFKSIQKEFNKATEYLRVSNLSFFCKEMKTRIEDLQFTKERYIHSHHFLGEEKKEKSTPLENINGKLKIPPTNRKRAISFNSELSHPSSFVFPRSITSSKSPSWKEVNETPDASLNSSSIDSEAKLSPSKQEESLSSSVPLNSPLHRFADSFPPLKTQHETPKQYPRGATNLKLSLSPNLSAHSVKTSRNSSRELILEGLSYSSDSSSSTVKSTKETPKPLQGGVMASSLMHDYSHNEGLTHSEEMSVLEHTSLDALAVQLLDCQYILEVSSSYLELTETGVEIDLFLEHIKSQSQAPLYAAMDNFGLLQSDDPEPPKEPSIFVISLMRRNFRNMRTIKFLCGAGYIACIAKLLDTHQRFSKSTLTLIFEDMDKDLHDNPFSSLFIGNIPIVNIGSGVKSSPPSRHFSLNESCWNEALIGILCMDPSKSATPESEYNDARESFDQDDVALADDCLEVFAAVEGDRRKSASSNSQVSEEGNSESEMDRIPPPKSSSVFINDQSHPSTPLRSTSSDSSWASSTPRDLTLDGIEGEEGEGEEEEVVSDPADTTSIKRAPHDINRRMESGKLYHMSALIQQFSGVSQCIVHSVLSGKPMIIAGPEYLKSVVVIYTKTLSTILPVKPNEFLPVLKWHTGTITPHHLKMYKIIGICIPERLHVQDLMSNATLNQVTVLNIETGHISGVAYSGNLLYKADQLSRRHFRSDLSLQAALQSILISLGMKVFVHFHLLKTTSRPSTDILKAIGVPRGDWLMVQHLSKMVDEQITENLVV